LRDQRIRPKVVELLAISSSCIDYLSSHFMVRLP
jgi:hypothetical protein